MQKFIIALTSMICLGLMVLPALASDPDRPLDQRHRSARQISQLLQQGNAQQAMQLANQLVQHEADKPEPYLMRAQVYLAVRNGQAALRDLQKANQLAPTDALVASSLANLLMQARQPQAAEQVLAPALQAHPNSVLLLVAQGDVQGAKNNLPAAVTVWEKARPLTKDKRQIAIINSKLAQAYNIQGKRDQAIAALDLAIAAVPDPRLISQRAQLHEQAGQLVGALTDYRKLLTFPAIEKNAQQRKAISERIAAVETALLEQRRQTVDEDAKQLIPIIDAYRRQPNDIATRQAVVEALAPLMAITPQDDEKVLLLPFDTENLEQDPPNSEPQDLRDALENFYRLTRQQQFNWNEVNVLAGQPNDQTVQALLDLYPEPRLLYARAIAAFVNGDDQEAYELALLAEAVELAEFYYDPAQWRVSRHSIAFKARQLAQLAHDKINNTLSDDDRRLVRMIQLEKNQQWVQADELRDVLNPLVLNMGTGHFDPTSGTAQREPRVAATDLLELGWGLHQDKIEAAYQQAIEQAIAEGKEARQRRMAGLLRHRPIKNQALVRQVLAILAQEKPRQNIGTFGVTETIDHHDDFARQLLSADPYNVEVWVSRANRALNNGNEELANLYFLTAEMIMMTKLEGKNELDQEGWTREKIGEQLKDFTGKKIYPTLKRFENRARETFNPGAQEPVSEMVWLFLARVGVKNDNHKAMAYRKAAEAATALRDYEDAQTYLVKALKLDPATADQTLYLQGRAYESQGNRQGRDTPEEAASFSRARAAYQQALAKPTSLEANKAIEREWEIRKRIANAYAKLGQVDQAIVGYRVFAEATAPNPMAKQLQARADAYYRMAKLSYDHKKASLKQISDWMDQCLALHREAKSPFISSSVTTFDKKIKKELAAQK